MHAAQDIYRELEYGVNPTILKAHTQAVDEVLMNPKLKNEKKLLELGILNARLRERLELIVSIQLSIKLATIKYFDEFENPFGYQHDYNAKKLEKWAKSGSVPAFFLNLPESQSMASGEELSRNLVDFLQGETIQNIKTLDHLTTLLASKSSEEDTMKTLDLQKLEQSIMRNWSTVPLTNIT